MTRNMILLTPVLLLASCGTPQENCIRKNTHEIRVLSDLLEETEGNLARGYAWGEREVTRSVPGLCEARVAGEDGKTRLITYDCWRDVVDIERYRIPIDPAVEQRKRDNLASKVSEQAARAEKVSEACKKAYPEEG